MAKRLIDADDAIKRLRVECVAKFPNSFISGLFAAADALDKIPTVDAVEVIRCADCFFYRPLTLDNPPDLLLRQRWRDAVADRRFLLLLRRAKRRGEK